MIRKLLLLKDMHGKPLRKRYAKVVGPDPGVIAAASATLLPQDETLTKAALDREQIAAMDGLPLVSPWAVTAAAAMLGPQDRAKSQAVLDDLNRRLGHGN